MKISKFKISSFRNITSADIQFNNVNVFTGKNSSGKTNLLKAITHSLDSREKQWEIFDDNITTHGSGYKKTKLEVTLSDIKNQACYVLGDTQFKCITPESIRFEKEIAKKNNLATDFGMFFTGKILDGNRDNLSQNWMDAIRGDAKDKEESTYAEDRVFSETYGNVEKSEGKKIIKATLQDESAQYFSYLHSNYKKSIVQWFERDKTYRSSANIVHEYVTQDYSPQEAEKILDLISKKELQSKRFMLNDKLSESLFATLIADIQINKMKHEDFKFELKHYSEGILDDAFIETSGKDRGKLFISSPNGPGAIKSISSGSAIILYFVAMKCWLELKVTEQSYDVPGIMIFDEIDSNVHPHLLPALAEIIRSISAKVQVFLSTHSPTFIDQFEKNQVFLLMDSTQQILENKNRVNIKSYQEIIDSIENKIDRETIENTSNSTLFIEGAINNLFHG